MNGQIDQLVKTLLQKDSLSQCSLQELEQFANRHPYFGAAQLLLTKKMQVERSAQYDEQLQKTYLFFHNPLWVQQLLNDNGEATITRAENKEVVVESQTREQVTADSTPSIAVIEEHTSISVFPGENIVQEAPVKDETTDSVQDLPVSVKDVLPPEEPVRPAEIVNPNGTGIPMGKVENDLVFEPYHTVDYFASQGIRFREEEKPVDKFGKQLKSFTDWLKLMKKLPLAEIAAKVEPAAERKVETLAADSLAEKEVVTEAMAEVWEKQGNREKAIAVYHKLSLLDPSKSAYFAAKIEELKKLN